MKKLSEMTLEELWELFPIFLTKHKDCWSEWYQEEKENILRLLSSNVKIHHIIMMRFISDIILMPILT